MGDKHDKFVFIGRLRLVFAAALFVALSGFLTVGFATRAEALPSFARQTGQPCGSCHTDFAGLTPYGRRFKIGGYTYGGGKYRTALFPDSDDLTDSKDKKWVPPISMMAIVGFTSTEAPQPPPTDPYKTNNNVVVSPLSFFWGGAITDHIGAFAQLTDAGPPVTASIGNDPYVHNWTWDNTDIRYADSTSIGNIPITYGITANNWTHGPGSLEYHPGLGLSLRRIDDRADASRGHYHRRDICRACRQRRCLYLRRRHVVPRIVGVSDA